MSFNSPQHISTFLIICTRQRKIGTFKVYKVHIGTYTIWGYPSKKLQTRDVGDTNDQTKK